MGKEALSWCKSEGLSCSSLLRAAGAWHFSGAGSYGAHTSWCARYQHQEQTEIAPVLTVKASTSIMILLKITHKELCLVSFWMTVGAWASSVAGTERSLLCCRVVGWWAVVGPVIPDWMFEVLQSVGQSLLLLLEGALAFFYLKD